MFTISVIVGSAILYRDFESANAERVGKFIGGCALTFLGVYFITSGRGSDEGTDDEETSESAEQGISLLDEEDQGNPANENEHTPTAAYSRRASRQPDARPANFQRLSSSKSNMSRPFTPDDDPDSFLVENPWAEAQGSLKSQRVISRNTTTSSIPTNTSEPSTPRRERRPPLTVVERSSASHRRSIADIFPGPIASPLSSSFTGVAADARRRDIDSPSGSKRSRANLLKSQSSGLHAQQIQDSFQDPSAVTDTDAEDVRTRPRPKRARSQSLGDAIGSFLRRPSKNPPDEEQGQHVDPH